MARANIARRHGDDFQARLFWLKAAALLDSASGVRSVAYEAGPKSFDDITVTYDPDAAPLDHEGVPVIREHIQCKWHTKPGAFGHNDLIDPTFINAQRDSFLQKARSAQRQHAPDGIGCRFKLLTNWRIDLRDPLAKLVREESDALDLDILMDGTGRSRMGRLRKVWCDHLGVDDEVLRRLVRTVVLAEAPASSLADLRERLDDKFAVVGMRRAPSSEISFPYDDLTAKLLAQGRNEFDGDTFRQMLNREGLLDLREAPRQPPVIGIRSFMHWIDNLEDRCERTLNLVPYFDGRYIRNPSDWEERIVPAVRKFVLDEARAADSLRLSLDVHTSLAFAVGALLNIKSGKKIEIEQRGSSGRRFWWMDDMSPDSFWPRFNFDDEHIGDGDGVAMAIGLTHDIAPAVSAYVRQTLPYVGRIIHCKPDLGPSHQSVQGGRHAWMLSESIVQHLTIVRGEIASKSPLHLFIAGPNAFTLFLGQQQQAIGPTALYEWDFDGQGSGTYDAGLSVG